jgi:hypothetical protein
VCWAVYVLLCEIYLFQISVLLLVFCDKDSYIVANNQFSLLSEKLLLSETLTGNATLQLRYFQLEPFGPF